MNAEYGIYALTGFTVLVFLISYIQDRRKIMNGFIFNILLCLSYISLLLFCVNSKNVLFLQVIVIISFIFLTLFASSIFIIMIVAFLSAKKLIQREGFRFANLLTLFLGVVCLFVIIFTLFFYAKRPLWLLLISNLFTLIIAYFVFIFLNFYMSSILYQVIRLRLNKDYIIVLGSGLIDGYKVGPLLANRIQKAIDFYQRQAKKRTPPRIVFSGGKGNDEQVAEAEAMQMYAINLGIPMENTLIETQSRNTFENMKFSKDLIESLGAKKYRAIFTTSNYHVFRSSIFAKRAKLDAQGLGAKTPFYFWSNAMLREYVAVLIMYKKFHMVMVGMIILVYIVSNIILFSPYF